MIETYTLRNGLRIVLEQVPTVRSVSIGIWILTGSRNETEENNGVSHFIEHMLFKGTKERTAQDIAEAFDSIGGYVNAFTAKEYTCYYARVLDSYKEYALEILADMFFNSTFLEEELDREKNVIMEEIKMYEDTPDDHVHDLLSEAFYGKHALGRTILGTEERLTAMTRETLINYMEKHYTPNNVVISIAGNVGESFITDIEKLFSTFNRPNNEIVLNKPTVEFQSIMKEKEIEQAHLCFGYKGLPANDDELISLLLINSSLGTGMSSRLFQEIREKRGLAYSVFSYHNSYADSGMLGLYAGTKKEQLPILIEAIDNTIEELVENGISEQELKSKKDKLKGNILLSLESTSSRMSRNGRNELLLQKHRTLDEIIEEIDAVDLNMIRRTIDYIFTGERAEAIIKPK